MELNVGDDKMTPQRVLGRQLRRLREQADLSQRSFGDEIRYPHSYLGRVERGQQLPSKDMAKTLDSYFDTGGLFAELLEAAQDALVADYSRTFLNKEPEAVSIMVFTSSIVPGLLQTADYARESFRVAALDLSDDVLDARVGARMKRQRVLDRNEPPFLWAVIDEAALRRSVGQAAIMRAQLHHLIAMVRRPNIRFQVLPFDHGMHPMMGGALTLLTPKDGRTIAHEESFRTGQTLESPRKVAELAHLFNSACAKAVPEEASVDLVRSYMEGYGDDD